MSQQKSLDQKVLSSIGLGVIVIDSSEKVSFWNDWVEEKSFIQADKAIGQQLITLFPELAQSRIPAAIRSCFDHRLPTVISNLFNQSPFPFFADKPNGKKIIQYITVTPVIDADKTACVIQIQDISASVDREKALENQVRERKKAESELLATMNELEKASSIKSEFLSAMSHELRTPINGILGMGQLLCETALNQEQKDYLRNINLSTKSLLDLVDSILDIASMESNQLEIHTVNCSLRDIISEITQYFTESLSNNNLKLKEIYDGKLAPVFHADCKRIKQIIINLVSNAIKFTEQGDIFVSVDVLENHRSSQKIKISVTDPGIGINKNDIDEIFENFSQVDSSTSKKYSGTGVGLALCKKLVTLMSGSIGVDSVEGSGSTFWFVLDLPIVESEQEGKSTSTRKPSSKTSFSGKALLVEDVLVNQMVAQAILTNLGLDVDLAENGKAAVEKFHNNHYDLIFMDCQMPVMDGFEASQIIRKEEKLAGAEPSLIIALTALAMEGDRDKCLSSGMDDYITKPYTAENVISVLQKWF